MCRHRARTCAATVPDTGARPPCRPSRRPSDYRFTPDGLADGEDLVGFGGDLAPGTVLTAYRSGVFPDAGLSAAARIGWWSPDPRGVLPIDGLRVSRSLRALVPPLRDPGRRTAYDEVIRACADVRRPGGWIRRDIRAAYTALNELGWAHSVEAWAGDRLAGGLYGVAIGGLFAGESMFHRDQRRLEGGPGGPSRPC
jgi:leucyl/phenylalanyl-tRNA--protein transferase